MKSIRWWRGLGLGLLLLVLAGVGAGGLLLTRYARPFAQREIRRALTGETELALAPFEVDFSLVRDFPYPTATLRHLALTDTAHGRAVLVLRIGEADLRLAARELLHRRVRITRLTVRDALLHQEVDSLGRPWGLRGKKRPNPRGHAPTLDVAVDSVLLQNFRITTHNDFIHSALGASASEARLALRLQGGALSVRGHFVGSLDELRNRTGTLLAHEPVRGRVHYRYEFGPRQGRFFADTRATLNGDTIALTGTHRADTVRTDGLPRGTWLNLRFAGSQPLVAVLRAVLPPTVRPYLQGAISPSKARLVYHISGLSGPRVRPHTVMQFGLRGASIRWPDSARRINRWDLQATYDNGPAHNYNTMSLRFDQCRVYSSVGQLDVSFLLRDFRKPYVEGRLHGRTDLPALAVLLPSSRWHASQGIADLNVRLRGLLPEMGPRRRGGFRNELSVFGTATIHDATLALTHRRTGLSHLNVQIGLRDSLWQLTNASGVLGAGMRFRASASTVHLLDYFTDQRPTARVTGRFELNELDLGQLRELVQRRAAAARRPPRTAAERRQLTATLGRRLIPEGLRLDVALHLGRLALATDTLRDLAVRVRHDGHQVRLSGIQGRLWDGEVRGQVQWPTDSTNTVAPVTYDVDFKFDTLSYRHLANRLSRPPRHSAKRPASPAVRELLLAANGHLRYTINTLALPDGEALRDVQLHLDKQGSALHLPELRFTAPQGGQGSGSALVLLDGLSIAAADADLQLHYTTLDVPRLLRMFASLAPPAADSVARQARQRVRARRLARRTARNGGQAPASMLTNGQFTALLHINADRVRYGAVDGGSFKLSSRLRQGEALLDECTLSTLGGRIALHGRLVTDAGRQHHPLQVQMLLENIQLPALFSTLTDMNLNVLTASNIRGTLRSAAVLHTDLDARFLPSLDLTTGYLKADIRNLELLHVEALEDALKVFKRRTSHLYFEPVSTEFVLSHNQLLIPDLRLDSNLTELQLSGRYGFDGRANLFVGLNPVHALLGNNRQRIARIRAGEEVNRHDGKLTYVNLSREQPRTKYQVRVFQKNEQRQQQAVLRRQSHLLIISQHLDTTLRLLPVAPFTASPAPATPAAAGPTP